MYELGRHNANYLLFHEIVWGSRVLHTTIEACFWFYFNCLAIYCGVNLTNVRVRVPVWMRVNLYQSKEYENGRSFFELINRDGKLLCTINRTISKWKMKYVHFGLNKWIVKHVYLGHSKVLVCLHLFVMKYIGHLFFVVFIRSKEFRTWILLLLLFGYHHSIWAKHLSCLMPVFS